MAAFDMSFDTKEWIREHGLATHGREVVLHLDSRHLGATIHIPSCASWEFPEFGVGQGAWNQHQGFRGTIGDLLEKCRSDVERNRGMYGEEAAPKFDAVLKHIDQMLQCGSGESEVPAVSLILRDPSGLCGVSADLLGCIAKDMKFERSLAEKMMLIPLGAPAPGEQLTTVEQIAELVRQAKFVVALTGAGISVESGITPFRNPSAGDKGSIWGTFNAAEMTVQNFNTDPKVTKAWWDMKRSLTCELRNAAPNPAHKFFSVLEQQGKLGAVVTQNIDSLHMKAGVSSQKVIELHGHMRGLICSDHKTPLNPQTFRSGDCTFSIPEENDDAIAAVYADDKVPLCPDCGCPLRTETVMFGQSMPLRAVDVACQAVDEADLLLVIGSTLIVQPANELPCIALRNGAPLVIINFDATQYDGYAKGLIRHKVGKFLGAVTEKLLDMPESLLPTATLRKPPKDMEKSQDPASLTQMRVAKEGSRCGKDMLVNTKACNMQFFCTAVSEPQGDFGLLEQSLVAMNAECPEIGKMIFSDGPDQLAVVASIPDVLASVLNCKDWLQEVSRAIGGNITQSTSTSGMLVVHASAESYPIKLKEPGITAAIRVLKDKGLFPVEDEEDDDWVFGDEDFPLC
mmetsp:Transcript_83977/g.166751  ORF Transcript_83977/g.166751 Transcript_83977/m.166751 type:complete len:627 (-) Transcript_83977:101-1981(-)